MFGAFTSGMPVISTYFTRLYNRETVWPTGLFDALNHLADGRACMGAKTEAGCGSEEYYDDRLKRRSRNLSPWRAGNSAATAGNADTG